MLYDGGIRVRYGPHHMADEYGELLGDVRLPEVDHAMGQEMEAAEFEAVWQSGGRRTALPNQAPQLAKDEPVPRRRDKPRQVHEILARLSVGQRVTIAFLGGPLAGIVLDSHSASESERSDLAWIIVKTQREKRGRSSFPATQKIAASPFPRLQVGDIDSARMVLHVRQGKGAKDRLVPLWRRLLEALRAYWRMCRPRTWLFPGHKPDRPITGSNVQRRFSRVVKQAGLSKRCSMHTLRHSYATHLLPVEYHHVVFTLRAELGELALANPAVVYDLLMRSAARTLPEVAANPKRLAAAVGVLMVLHTWGQNLHHHPHVNHQKGPVEADRPAGTRYRCHHACRRIAWPASEQGNTPSSANPELP
jgi:hypothetical protein